MRWQELVCYRREGSRPWAGPCRGIEISIPPCFGERTLDESRNTYSRRTRGKGTTNTNRRLPIGYVLPDVLRDRDYAFGPFERGLRPNKRPVGTCKDKEHRSRPPVRLSGPGHRKTLQPTNARIFRQLRRYACHIFVDRPLRVSTRYFRQNTALLRAKGGRRRRSRCGHLVHSNSSARQEL